MSPAELRHSVLASGTPVTVAVPRADRPQRGLVLFPDIMGLRPLFDELAQRLAGDHRWGIAAVEPWAGREDLSIEQRLDRVNELDDARLMADAAAAAGLVDVEPVGVLGFCMGGMLTLKAATLDRFDRAVSFYGMVRLPPAWRSPAMADPIDILERTGGAAASKVLALIGTADPYLPPGDVDHLEAAGATVVRYEGAEHGFVHDASRPAHRPTDAADAWRRAVAWLAVEP